MQSTQVVDALNAGNPRAGANAECTDTPAIKIIFTFKVAVNLGARTRTFKLTQDNLPVATGWPTDPTDTPPPYPPFDPTGPPTYPPIDPTAPPTYPPFDPTNPPDPAWPEEPAPDTPTYPDDPVA